MTEVMGNPASVLVVDDLEENVRILTRFLTIKGFEVRSASDGEQALVAVDEQHPDIILLDLVMPRMDGFEVCRRLKADPATRHIPVIVISGVAEKEANVRAIEVGADDFLLKPFDSVLLDARIRSSIRTKRLQDQILEYQQTLEQRIRERTNQLARAQHSTVFSLAKLAESRDTETGAHLDRIRAYAREVAVCLRDTHATCANIIDDPFIEALYYSSPLHDIGKVGIPDRILLKPGKLTPEEFDIMKMHAVIGGDTLKAADLEAGQNYFLSMGRDVAYHHHEKWNGTGYPFGLSGEDIPLAARIVAISDVYDALVSRRPYKEPMSHEKAKGIIVEGKGAHFDPAIVEAFLQCEDRILDIRTQYQDSSEPALLQQVHARLDQLDTPPVQ